MRKTIHFIIITFVFSWTAWGLQYLGQEGHLPEWVQLFGMFGVFGPFVSFMIMVKSDGKKYRDVFKDLFKKAPTWTILFVILSPFILSGVSYIVYRQFAEGNPEPLGVTLASFLPIALMILIVGGPIEEFGWRGYLLPKLRSSYSFIVTILIMGIIHGLWHLPLHFLNGTVQQAIPIYEFLLVTIAITVSYVFIYEYTKSLIPFILLHWAANYSSAVFPYFYNVEGRYALLIVTLLLDAVLIVIYFRRKIVKKEQ